jgi:hypothetical protein
MTTAATGRSHLPVVHAATIDETRSSLCGCSQDCEIALRVDDAGRRNRDSARDLQQLSDGSRTIQRPQGLKNLMVIAFYPYRAYKNVTRTLSCTAVSRERRLGVSRRRLRPSGRPLETLLMHNFRLRGAAIDVGETVRARDCTESLDKAP